MTWYEEMIEPGIRSIVKLLRDNGFNTVSSCEHKMQVDIDFLPDGEIQRMHNLLYNQGYRDYTLIFKLEVREGHQYPDCLIQLPDGNGGASLGTFHAK